MDMYDNLKPLTLTEPVSITLPVLAWASIASWYATVEGICPEMNWLNMKVLEAVLLPSAFKALEANNADAGTFPGLLRRLREAGMPVPDELGGEQQL